MIDKVANILQLKASDNVGIALTDLYKGDSGYIRSPVDDSLALTEIVVKDDIPFGHKIALRRITANNEVVKYGYVIGLAIAAINVGAHVHVHNIVSNYFTHNSTI